MLFFDDDPYNIQDGMWSDWLQASARVQVEQLKEFVFAGLLKTYMLQPFESWLSPPK